MFSCFSRIKSWWAIFDEEQNAKENKEEVKMSKNKKAAMEMSMGTIVTVVLSMAY